MNSTINQNVKNILNDLFRAKLIPVDAEAAIAGIQDGREEQRAPIIATLLRIRSVAENALMKLGAARSSQEAAVQKAKAALEVERGKLRAIVEEETGISCSSQATVLRLERELRALSDPLYSQTLLELSRVADLARYQFAHRAWKEPGLWQKVSQYESNAGPVEAVRHCAKVARERIEQLQTEPRPDDLCGYLTKLVEPVEMGARDLGIQTRWPWASTIF